MHSGLSCAPVAVETAADDSVCIFSEHTGSILQRFTRSTLLCCQPIPPSASHKNTAVSSWRLLQTLKSQTDLFETPPLPPPLTFTLRKPRQTAHTAADLSSSDLTGDSLHPDCLTLSSLNPSFVVRLKDAWRVHSRLRRGGLRLQELRLCRRCRRGPGSKRFKKKSAPRRTFREREEEGLKAHSLVLRPPWSPLLCLPEDASGTRSDDQHNSVQTFQTFQTRADILKLNTRSFGLFELMSFTVLKDSRTLHNFQTVVFSLS